MVRPAAPADASAIASLIRLAMGDLAARFANNPDPAKAQELFTRFAAGTGSQYSYQNVLVWDEAGEVGGMILAYDGGQLDNLRQPFLAYTRAQLGFTGQPEDETRAGEYYIDCLAVSPAYQGKGIAKKLIRALFDKATEQGNHTVGLLVSKGNNKATKLYTDLGFEVKGGQSLLAGDHYHLQYEIS